MLMHRLSLTVMALALVLVLLPLARADGCQSNADCGGKCGTLPTSRCAHLFPDYTGQTVCVESTGFPGKPCPAGYMDAPELFRNCFDNGVRCPDGYKCIGSDACPGIARCQKVCPGEGQGAYY